MRTIVDDFGISEEKMVDLWCSLNGDMGMIRKLLKGKPVVVWSYLEDLALQKPEESEEFQVLLRAKGSAEIDNRKKFLLFDEDEA